MLAAGGGHPTLRGLDRGSTLRVPLVAKARRAGQAHGSKSVRLEDQSLLLAAAAMSMASRAPRIDDRAFRTGGGFGYRTLAIPIMLCQTPRWVWAERLLQRNGS